ncbi:dephospho-CoA kinase [Allofustis seminis]|uniref:dephospho-CoA kinase n=1 Tax=Allofustis seminis TaxID=166939 RepID=UPI00058F3693|nr:dephospho-CoA kinase [Allofustis seminis]
MKNKKIGLTGGIASGKSTVSKLLKDMGAYVIDADAVARDIVHPGTVGLAKLVEQFGDEILLENQELDRKKLGALVFSSPHHLKRLNIVIQPLIRKEIRTQMELATDKNAVIVVDIPLLYEEQYQGWFDEILVVAVDAQIQLQRLMARDHLSEAQAKERIQAQIALAEKVKRADVVIDNSKTIAYTQKQIEQWWKQTHQSDKNLCYNKK